MPRTLSFASAAFFAALTLLASGCDSASSAAGDCRTQGQECTEGWSCQANASGAYECLADGSSFGTSDPNDPSSQGEETNEGSGTSEPPSTDCLYPFGALELEEDFGRSCTSDTDCAHGTCLMPGMEGNITNNVFAFCTRGCDCDDAAAAKLSSEDDTYHCVYPGGCFIGESQGAWRHAALRCSTLEDCQMVDSRYTHCATTDSMTVVEDTCGSLRKVCQAHQ